MSDSRLKSITEAAFNIAAGYPISLLSNVLILPNYDFAKEPWLYGAEVGLWYTIISVVRQYGLRRFFNHFGEKENFYTLAQRLWRRLRKVSLNNRHVR